MFDDKNLGKLIVKTSVGEGQVCVQFQKTLTHWSVLAIVGNCSIVRFGIVATVAAIWCDDCQKASDTPRRGYSNGLSR